MGVPVAEPAFIFSACSSCSTKIIVRGLNKISKETWIKKKGKNNGGQDKTISSNFGRWKMDGGK